MPAALELVAPEVRSAAASLGEQFRNARPFRHLCIDDFFAAPFVQTLAESFPDFDQKLALNENAQLGRKAVNEKVTALGPAWKSLDELVQSKEFRQLVSLMTGIPDLCYDPHYFGGGTHENLDGQGLDAHVDFNFHPGTRQHRRLNLILYLTPEWDDAWGGSIQLHRDPYLPPSLDEVVTITPAFNRMVIFETNEHSWHGFPRIRLPQDKKHLSRRSFALYYYTETRPAEELGTEHSTIYVEEHLPEDWRPGMVLDDEQLAHLRSLLSSRDMHLRRLYGSIKRLYGEINHLREQRGLQLPPGVAPEDDEGQAHAGLSQERRLLINRAELGRLRARVHELEQSTSWRITAPLRNLKKLLGKR
jgi:hypothetical protein